MSNRAASVLASGDYVFLAILAWSPMSAYDVKKFMTFSVNYFWTAAHSQVYQQARRLVRDGYVKERDVPGGRRKRILSLTPKGRRAVVRWLRAPAEPPQFFSEPLVKLFFARQGDDLAATRRMLEIERRGVSARIAELQALAPHVARTDEGRFPALTIDFGLALYRATLRALDGILRDLEPEGPDPTSRRA